MSRIESHYLNRANAYTPPKTEGDALERFATGLGQGARDLADFATPIAERLVGAALGGGVGFGPLNFSMNPNSASSDYAMQNMLLEKQRQMNLENQIWSMRSNVEKANHETRKALIYNIKP